MSAFLDYLSLHTARYYRSNRQVSSLDVIPLPRAICKILYVFCKVRGNKVICRFLNNEPKYLEPILMALEIWTTGGTSAAVEDTSNHGPIVWEERFIMLLWLSHLMLAPFDLISMSSDNPGTDIGSPLLQIHWPESMPPIVNRLVNIASHHLGLPGKEREAAATLLVRLAVRVDMHRNGVQETLVNWSLSSLKTDPHNATATSVYAVIGIFSFLAGFVSSAETIVLKPLLMLIYNSIQQATSEPSPFYTETTSSAVARKLVIKIYRALAVAAIRSDTIDAATVPSLGEDGLEETIDRLLTALADKETSIRFAASKALSVISAHLEPDMVAQIVTVIEQSLIEDTLWEDASTGQSISGSDLQAQEVASASSLPESFELSLVAVNPLRWHGLVLSLAQLIFRGSMPRWMIPKAMTSLVLALQFEQRSSLGVSIGTNVRDAACFGLWALVRRYTTAELWGERTSKLTGQMESTIQVIANELVVAATLDASGNIRRGASAALQEMVGRHPDVIEDGISLVQAVDYHAVALRSNAMLEIAIRVSKSHRAYWYPILNGLLDWRGVLASDPQARHNAAEAVGRLVEHSHLLAISTTEILQKRLDRTPLNKAEERNGMLLALAQIVFARSNECLNRILVTKAVALNELMESKLTELCQTWYINCPEWIQINSPTDFERPPPFALPHPFSVESVKMKIVDLVLRTDLGCEAVCLLIHNISMAVAAETALSELSRQMSAEDLNLLKEAVEKSLQHSDPLVVSISSMAAGRLFRILDNDSQEEIVRRWARLLSSPGSITQEDRRLGLAAALGAVFVNIRKQKDMRPSQSEPLPSADFPPFSVPIVISEDSGDEEEPDAKKKPPSISPLRNIIISTLLSQLNNEHGVDLRCTVLRSLTSGVLESDGMDHERFLDIQPANRISNYWRAR